MTLSKQLPSDIQFVQTSRRECVRNLELPAMSGCITITSPLARYQLFRVSVRIAPHPSCEGLASPQKALNKPSKMFLKAGFSWSKGRITPTSLADFG